MTKALSPKTATFVADVDAIRKRARQHIEDGAVTDSYKRKPRSGDQDPQGGIGH